MFTAAQQTSTAKLPAFLKKILKLVHALRVNGLRVFLYRTEQVIKKFTYEKKHVQKFDVRRQAKQKLEEIGFYFNISATQI